MKRVLALDPGDRVGWARVDIDEETGEWSNLRHGITELKPMALAVDRALAVGDGWEQADDDLNAIGYDVVVCEEWKLYASHAKTMIGSEIPSAQFIGMVKLACWKAGVPLVMQGARLVNSNRPGVLAPAEASMRKLRPELYEFVMQPGAHDDQHDLVAIKHLWAYTFAKFPVEVQHGG